MIFDKYESLYGYLGNSCTLGLDPNLESKCNDTFTRFVLNTDCNEYSTIDYNISRYGINLLTFNGIDSIKISGKYVKYLKNIPETVHTLIVDIDNYEKNMDFSFIANTKIINIYINDGSDDNYYSIDKLKNIPLQIIRLSIVGLGNPNSYNFEQIFNLPNLQELYIDNCQIGEITQLPDKLKILYLSHSDLTNFSNLPESLEKLYLKYCQQDKIIINNLPNNITDLTIIDEKDVIEIENIPESVKYFYANLKLDLGNLPNSIETLFVINNKSFGKPNNNIKKLTIKLNKDNIDSFLIQNAKFDNITDLCLIWENHEQNINSNQTSSLFLPIFNLEKLTIHGAYGRFNIDKIYTFSTKLNELKFYSINNIPDVLAGEKKDDNTILIKRACSISKIYIYGTKQNRTMNIEGRIKKFNIYLYPNLNKFLLNYTDEVDIMIPKNIRFINLFDNKFLRINFQDGSELKYLVCEKNPINSLENLPSSLTYLNCKNTGIKSIINVPEKLSTICCEQDFNLNNFPANILIKTPNIPHDSDDYDKEHNEESDGEQDEEQNEEQDEESDGEENPTKKQRI